VSRHNIGGDLNFIMYVIQEGGGGQYFRKSGGGASSGQSFSNSEDGDSSIMIMTVISPRVKMSSEY
jgi:hypothetical protein